MTKKSSSAIQRRLIPSYIFLIIVSFVSVFPIFWMVTAATNNTVDIARGKIWFGNQAMVNLKSLIDAASSQGAGTSLGRFMGNSFFYAFAQTILCIFLCSLAGYGFELYHDKAKDRLFTVLLMAMMVPAVATLIPLFTMMSKLGFINTVAGFMLPAISTPFMIMMFRQNSRNFPVDIMEAARIDGLSEWAIFFKMYMPIMKSTYHDEKQCTDDADTAYQPFKRLCHRLRTSYDGGSVLFDTDHGYILRNAEAVCGRNHRRC